jgi:ubiquitin-like protein 4
VTQQAKQKTITATLKPMRGGDAVTIPDLTLDSTIHDIKSQYAQNTGPALDRIKLLLNKKPAADLKTLKELGIEGDHVELSVMIMGGAAASATSPAASSPVVEKSQPIPAPAPADKMDIDEKTPAPESEKAQAEAESKPDLNSAEAILKSEDFWNDLKGYLAQRLRDEKEGDRLAKLFREAYGG